MPIEFMKFMEYIDELLELRVMKMELSRYLNKTKWIDGDDIREIVGLPKNNKEED